MEVVRDVLASCAGGSEFDLTEAVGGTGRHRTALPSAQVINHDLQTMGGVMHGEDQIITGIHEQVGVGIGRDGVDVHIDRVGWSMGFAALGNECEVDILDTREKQLRGAGGIQRLAGHRVEREAVNIEGRAPLPC